VHALATLPGREAREAADPFFGIQPMLATSGDLPAGPDWAYEIKWDGIRALVSVSKDGVKLRTRNGHDVTERYGELAELKSAIRKRDLPLLLDGEIVAFDDAGVPSFGRLQKRMNVTGSERIRLAQQSVPIHFAAFDLPVVRGERIVRSPYDERREALAGLGIDLPSASVPRNYPDGEALLTQLTASGFEGVVAKTREGLYLPGRRSQTWLKVKRKPRQEFVVGGWTPGTGRRESTFGALLLGVHPTPGDRRLTYVGNVGSGFTDRDLDLLANQLATLARKTSPFDDLVDDKDAQFVSPKIVAEIEYQQMTGDGRLRHPIFKGVRTDKPAADVVFEGTQPGSADGGE
jgi:bifunctional non-homologous end joining protein LigD